MRTNFGLFVVIYFVVNITGVCLLENYIKEDPYKNVRVEFPDDLCDDRELMLPDYRTLGRRTSEVKCMEYIWRIKYAQQRYENRIRCEMQRGVTALLGGGAAAHGEYPHMGALGWKAIVGKWIFKCGGSLISEKFVLTAAHCSSVKKTDPTVSGFEPKIVRLGSKSISDTVDGRPAYDIGIRRFINHHRYKPSQHYFDVALVELVEEATFNWKVHPACLWTTFDNPETGELTGWGITEKDTLKTSPILQKAEIRIVDSVDCDSKLKYRHNRKWQGIMRHQLCAGDKSGRIDTCQGDSGGPLQIVIPLPRSYYIVVPWNIHQIVGVTSFGFGCARKDTPSVYTRVASFVGWIENIVWPINITRSHEDNEARFLFVT
ncbi:jg12975 [Pararge aegeria aegeria]|uniref:Jg12975 protein n=1 Tax=Pararge aegeria aegeria TaxID=348720 RepID=A0A8S4RVV5_9NEOP|nr:jg12975 [Pararge aegeria aegeria]